jgi:GNAT superfamily N-acetyltransferase/predicted enzyme related to lactoylglutathione lyase
MIEHSTAVLAVADVMQTVRFYVDVLGFQQRWLWGTPPTFGCIGAGRAELFLCQQPELAGRVEGHMHCLFVECETDIDALCARHRDAGAEIVSPIENKPWGIREYTVRDPSGYHLRFGGPVTYERPATATDALPPHIRIEVGLPELQTYRSLFTSVSWNCHDRMAQVLENSLFAILAIDTRDGQPVGMTRVTGDGWQYMIWDVIVRPSHQGQKIGRTMLQAALAELHRRGAPEGAFIGLFTGRQAFYERVGFKRSGGMHVAL